MVDGGRDFVGGNHHSGRRAQENHNGRTIQRKIKKLAGEKWNNMTVLQISLARVSIFASKFSLFFLNKIFPIARDKLFLMIRGYGVQQVSCLLRFLFLSKLMETSVFPLVSLLPVFAGKSIVLRPGATV